MNKENCALKLVDEIKQRRFQRNIEALFCNHFCSGKGMSITYSDCVFVALVNQHAKRIDHTVICGLSVSIKFFPHYQIKGSIFGGGLLDIKCVL